MLILSSALCCQDIVITTTLTKLSKTNNAELPPLRNPPMLESADDLINLSYLNEPAGCV